MTFGPFFDDVLSPKTRSTKKPLLIKEINRTHPLPSNVYLSETWFLEEARKDAPRCKAILHITLIKAVQISSRQISIDQFQNKFQYFQNN